MPAYVIYINGFPGVGKLTVARHLQTLIPDSQVLHNHELIDPVEKRCARGSARYQLERSLYRQKRLKSITSDPELQDTVFIFTDSQMEFNECVSDYTSLCLEGRRFYSVILHSELEENLRRMTLPGRGGGENGKLTDGEVLKEYRSRDGILKFGDEDEIEIDITDVPAAVAAERVRAFVEKREKEGKSWVDEYA